MLNEIADFRWHAFEGAIVRATAIGRSTRCKRHHDALAQPTARQYC
jgi:hypothetical protein